MGTQQFLLLLLVLVLIGIAVVVGISLANDAAIDSNRQVVMIDLHHLASLARKHYRTPTFMGGGGGTFDNFEMPPGFAYNLDGDFQTLGTNAPPGNAYGWYKKKGGSSNEITFEGIGKEVGRDDTNPIRVEATVSISIIQLEELN